MKFGFFFFQKRIISSPSSVRILGNKEFEKEFTAVAMLYYCCGESQVDLTGSILLNKSRSKDYNRLFLS